MAQGLTDLARLLYEHRADHARAQAMLEEALMICRAIGDQSGIGHALSSLAELADLQGYAPQALQQQLAALTIFEPLNNQLDIATALLGLAEISWHCGDYRQARRYADLN